VVGNETPALEPKNLQKPTTYDPPRGAMTCYDRQYLSKQDLRRLLRLLNIRKTSHFVEEQGKSTARICRSSGGRPAARAQPACSRPRRRFHRSSFISLERYLFISSLPLRIHHLPPTSKLIISIIHKYYSSSTLIKTQ